MEPLSLLAGAVTSYVLPKALEKIGEKIGELAIERSGETIQIIRKTVHEKLSSTGTDGVLAFAQAEPSEANISSLENVILNQMKSDSFFAEHLQILLEKVQSQSPSLQAVLDGVRIRGNTELGNVKQTIDRDNAQQVIGRNMGVGGDFRVGNIVQDISKLE